MRSNKRDDGSCQLALVVFKYIIVYLVHPNMLWHKLFFHLSLEAREAAGMIHCTDSNYLPYQQQQLRHSGRYLT